MSHSHDPSPFNPLPPVVVVLSLALFGIEAVFNLGARGILGGAEAVGWRLGAAQTYGFYPQVVDAMLREGVYPLEHLMRFFTYSFVHFSFTHMLFAVVFILALGNVVGRVFSGLALLTVFFGSAIGGALAYWLIVPDPLPLVGGYPAAYGLIGAFTFLLWTNLAALGENQYRAFTLIGFLMGIQLVFGVLFGTTNDWVGDIGGFATGFGLSFVVSPGGWSALMARLRQR